MGANKFLPFAQGVGANVLSQTDYAGDAQRVNGNQPGVARSQLVNKAIRQGSVMAAAMAQIIADTGPGDVDDTMTVADLAAAFLFSVAVGSTGTTERDLYVATGGSDTLNNGLTALTPFATIGKALEIAAGYNNHVWRVNIHTADGAYPEDPQIYADNVYLLGNTATPANVTVNSLTVYGCNSVGIFGFTLTEVTTCLTLDGGSAASIGDCNLHGRGLMINGSHLFVQAGVTVSGNHGHAFRGHQNSSFLAGSPIACAGNPVYTEGFVFATMGASFWFLAQPTGAATGPRYFVGLNATINTEGGGANYLPGNAAGSATTGGQYA